MGRTQYIGARYVPLFADPEEWTSTRAYEALTVVLHEGNSYTSKQAVPVGIDISNSEFWALTGNYNAQVEQYREEVQELSEKIPNIYTALEIGLKNDNATDNTPILRAFLQTHINATIIFDCGIYRFSPLDISGNTSTTGYDKDYTPGFSLIGANYSFANPRMLAYAENDSRIDYDTFYEQDAENMTVFAPIASQQYVFDISVISSVTLKNIFFTTIGNDTLYEVPNVLKLHRCIFSLFENLHFCYVNGCCIESFNCYENRLLNSDFRLCIAIGNPALHGCVEFTASETNQGVNSSAWNICNINFEGVLSNWFFVNDARVQNVSLSNIIGECYAFTYGNYTGNKLSHDSFPDLDLMHSLAVIGFYDNNATTHNVFGGFIFESISVDLIGFYTFNHDDEVWGMNSIVTCYNNCPFSVCINSVQISSPSVNCYIYSGSDEVTGNFKSLICGNIQYESRTEVSPLKVMRGTLSELKIPRNTRTTSVLNNYMPFTKLFELSPTIYLNSSRMWKQSSMNNAEPCRLAPTGSTEAINSAYIFSAVGVSKVVVVAGGTNTIAGGSNLTVKRVAYNSATHQIDTLDTATKVTGSAVEVYTLEIDEPYARTSNIVIESDGTNRAEIYNVIVS